MGEAANLSFSKVSKQVVMSFRVAGVALRDIPDVFCICVDNVNFVRQSRTQCSFCSAHVFRKVESAGFPVAGAVSMGDACKISHFAWQVSQAGSDVSCCVFFAGIALCDRAASSGDFLANSMAGLGIYVRCDEN